MAITLLAKETGIWYFCVMPGVLLIGYDVEFGSDDVPPGLGPSDATEAFLLAALSVHRETGTSATLFVTGQTLAKNAAAFQDAAGEGVFDFQQHTYSHRGLKALWAISEGEHVPAWCTPGMSLDQIKDEVSKTNGLLRDLLGVECIGLTAPTGCHLGLFDRPDILSVLHSEGIRFVRSWGRDHRGRFYLTPGACQEKVQPFWYEPAGFGDVLEFPMHGNDYNVRNEMGWDDAPGYLAWTKRQVDHAAERDIVWSYAIHDHSAIRDDPEMSLVREMVGYALDRGLTVHDYHEAYTTLKDGRTS